MANHAPQAPKTPFVLLVLCLLGGGLVTLLLLSSASSADAFTQRRLQQENRALTLQEQELGRQVAALEAPGALAERARKLGLVPGADAGLPGAGPGRRRLGGRLAGAGDHPAAPAEADAHPDRDALRGRPPDPGPPERVGPGAPADALGAHHPAAHHPATDPDARW